MHPDTPIFLFSQKYWKKYAGFLLLRDYINGFASIVYYLHKYFFLSHDGLLIPLIHLFYIKREGIIPNGPKKNLEESETPPDQTDAFEPAGKTFKKF
mgnify:CR=1 FL=1